MNYTTRHIKSSVGKEFIKAHHYSKGCHNGPMCYGLFSGDRLIGVCAFATPSSENVRASVFGPEHKNAVTELHRLVILDETPTNTESWFIARALKWIATYRPDLRGILSFADATEGHRGVIYQATNALYCGTTSRTKFYRDDSGRLRHPRQNGVNITPALAKERGWTSEMRAAKHRYLFLVGTHSQRRWARKNLALQPQPYPKEESTQDRPRSPTPPDPPHARPHRRRHPMIDRNHPAVTRCFPDGKVTDQHIIMAESFAEVIREALPHLTADDLHDTPAGRALMAEAWEACADEFCKQGIVQVPDNPYREETPNE